MPTVRLVRAFNHHWIAFIAVALGAVAGCGASSSVGQSTRLFSITADLPAPGDEQYLCFGFDAAALDGASIREIRPATHPGPATVHHLSLFAVSAHPDGPVVCNGMPEGAIELFVWAGGAAPLSLPDGVGLKWPVGAHRLVVQAHVLRTAAGPAAHASIEFHLQSNPPNVAAAWLPIRAPVPAIRPHHVETATASCKLSSSLHLASAWPHMHRIGSAFDASIVRSTGVRESLFSVSPFSFDEQRTIALDSNLGAGDAIGIQCTWDNQSGDYVLPGLLLSNEMCGASLVAWPAEAARCND